MTTGFEPVRDLLNRTLIYPNNHYGKSSQIRQLQDSNLRVRGTIVLKTNPMATMGNCLSKYRFLFKNVRLRPLEPCHIT